ncbi:MAG: DUF6798 domain-containing protein [Planctomycetaceae bacterium]
MAAHKANWIADDWVLERFAGWRTSLLKFYPFRFADAALPWFVATAGAMMLDVGLRRLWSSTAPPLLLVLSASALAAAAWLPAPDANASTMPADRHAAWVKTCRWIREHTPADALVGTANETWAVNWYADRAEYVSFKNCPQDAAGIIEWWDRRKLLVRWSGEAKADGSISEDDLADLHRLTGMNFLIVSRYGPIDATPVHQTKPFQVYALQPASQP